MKKLQWSCFSVEPALFLYMFASFLSYPVYQQLLFHTLCSSDLDCSMSIQNHSLKSCQIQDSPVLHFQNEASHWILYTNLACSLPAILLSLLYGSLSDVFGRKYIMIIPAIGSAVNSIIIIIVQYTNPAHFWIYLIGAGASGVAGGFVAFNFTAYAYVADCSSDDNRTQRISWLEATTYLSSFLSLLLSGVWIESHGYGIPYLGVLACQVTVVFYIVLFLPASTNSQLQLLNAEKKARGLHLNGFSSVMKLIAINLKSFLKLLFTSWRLSVLSFMFFVLEVNFLGITDTVILYSLSRLCWSPDIVGYFLAEKSFFNAIAAMIFLPLLMKLKVKDTIVAIVGLFAGAFALVIMGIASQSWIMFLAPLIGCMRGCVVPIVRSLMSKYTPKYQQGVMFSGLSIIEASCILFSSSLYNALFPLTYPLYPGFIFFIMALCSLLLIPLMYFLHLKSPQDDKSIN